ncbi:hypothetical protein EXIGLDRAFT_703853 [Exidia glandulosa HHB12029]|uniref:Uncharacterized protein n=1 Tax=Exidia glandulosa HHB12029 TaxID=1314781 RepID=A0A165L3K3_EXIGL|nr:hypothetical protein EXIGLDRAFT_703853 [Exidia glandulosa HHB12029]
MVFTDSFSSSLDGSLVDAGTAVTEIRSALQNSIYTAASIETLLPRLVHKLKHLSHNPEVEEIRFVSTRIEEEISQDASSVDTRWRRRLQLGALAAAGPSFATAIISAVYNSTNPGLSQAMALARYWESTTPAQPQRSDLISVQLDAWALRGPLAMIAKWWRRLHYKLIRLAGTCEGPEQVAQHYEAMTPSISQYTKEVMCMITPVDDELTIGSESTRYTVNVV